MQSLRRVIDDLEEEIDLFARLVRNLCAIKDCYSNKIGGYSIDSRMKSSLEAAAFRNAIALRSPEDTICHSDRGSQFRSKKVMRLLKTNGLKGSMGRVASSLLTG